MNYAGYRRKDKPGVISWVANTPKQHNSDWEWFLSPWGKTIGNAKPLSTYWLNRFLAHCRELNLDVVIVPTSPETADTDLPPTINPIDWVIDAGLCPRCGDNRVSNCHHAPYIDAMPECDYLECDNCGYQWDHT